MWRRFVARYRSAEDVLAAALFGLIGVAMLFATRLLADALHLN